MLGDTKEGKAKASKLAKRVSKRGRHWLADGRRVGREDAKEMTRQEPSEMDEGGMKSRERRVSIYVAGAAVP